MSNQEQRFFFLSNLQSPAHYYNTKKNQLLEDKKRIVDNSRLLSVASDADDLYYYRARYYDPNTQRFLSLDPIGFEAGDFNFYRYVGNDPVNYVDLSGLTGMDEYAWKIATGRTQAGLQTKIDAAKEVSRDTALLAAGIEQFGSKLNPFTKEVSKILQGVSACSFINVHLLQKEKDGKLDEFSILTDLYTNLTEFVKKHPLIEFGIDEATNAASSEIFDK